MKKISRKHHYLPRHYLKGFTDESNGFFVYDKKNDKIFQSSPDAKFFENNLNTIELENGQKSDFLEDLYTDIENTCWYHFDTIRNSSRLDNVDQMSRMHLLLFLLFLHWRLPANQKYVKELSKQSFDSKSTLLDFFYLENKDGSPVDLKIIETIKNSPAFIKSSKMLIPFAMFYKNKDWSNQLMNWKFAYIDDSDNWFFVGDNPLVTRGESDHDPIRCLDEFIFPISGKILLINSKSQISNELSQGFVIQYAVSMLERSQRFIAHSNKDFLQSIIDYHKIYKDFNKTNRIMDDLLKELG